MTELWAGNFGTEYTRRNEQTNTDHARTALWRAVLNHLNVNSILEVGANIGSNLQAISTFSRASLNATEPNHYARDQLVFNTAIERITDDYADSLSFADASMELVFTSGVLIHIPTAKLVPSMREIHRVSSRYIICAEYFAPQEEMIPYRGHDNALWRRDYGSLYLDNFNDLYCEVVLFAWQRTTGLDNLTVWVFEKGPKRH